MKLTSPYALLLGSWVYHHYLDLLTASVIFSTLLSIYLYLSSFKKGAMLSGETSYEQGHVRLIWVCQANLVSGHGESGYPWYDLWMGRELNPRLGSMFDLKEFCELYPGDGNQLILLACSN